jgi:beta-lactamase regulating signal transducer with metallopeptidase domain
MSALFDMLVPAVGVTLLALACLALLPRAPATVRFWIASAGLAAWAVPWPLIKWTLPLALANDWPALPLAAGVDASGGLAAAQNAGGAAGAPVVTWIVAAAFAVGAAWFVVDCVRARAVVRSWRSRSTDAGALRALLPAHLRATRAALRIVHDSPHAAASGYWRPTIWIGDEIGNTDTVRVALLHECWHVRRRDPLKVLVITAVRRLYWWNPLVRALASHAALLLEAECDRRCARDVGKNLYVTELARTMLAASSPPPLPLAAASGTRGSNLLRLDLLNRETLMRSRDHVVLWAFAASAIALAACQSVQPEASATALEARDTLVGGASGGTELTADSFVLTQNSRSTVLSGNVRMKTTAERLVVLKSDRTAADRDSITLTGKVLLALDGSDVEADEVTIRALDGRPLELRPQGRVDIEGRAIELTTPHARLTSAYLAPEAR